jgi:hypothetical protein
MLQQHPTKQVIGLIVIHKYYIFSLNKNVNLWGKEGLPNTFGKGNKVLVNFLNKRAYPETQQTMLFLTLSRS